MNKNLNKIQYLQRQIRKYLSSKNSQNKLFNRPPQTKTNNAYQHPLRHPLEYKETPSPRKNFHKHRKKKREKPVTNIVLSLELINKTL